MPDLTVCLRQIYLLYNISHRYIYNRYVYNVHAPNILSTSTTNHGYLCLYIFYTSFLRYNGKTVTVYYNIPTMWQVIFFYEHNRRLYYIIILNILIFCIIKWYSIMYVQISLRLLILSYLIFY